MHIVCLYEWVHVHCVHVMPTEARRGVTGDCIQVQSLSHLSSPEFYINSLEKTESEWKRQYNLENRQANKKAMRKLIEEIIIINMT